MIKKKPAIKNNEEFKFFYFLKKLFALRLTKIILAVAIVLLLAPFVLFFILRPIPQKNIQYGVTFSKKYCEQLGLDWKDTFIKTLDDLGAKNLRLVVYWDDVERTKDKYDYSDIKWQLEEAQKRNASVILTIGKKVPRYPECFEPDWWKKIDNQTTKDNQLYEYIKESVIQLKGYSAIKIWQVENEPFFPFGTCEKTTKQIVETEIKMAKSLDARPVLVQDSGEGGFWLPTYQMGDYLGISMYRKIWYDFWGAFMGRFIYFQYPLAHWTYKIKANIVGVPMEKIYVTELQAEPWGPGLNSKLTKEEKDKSMSKNDFIATINYAQNTGFDKLYLWGVEWWLWEKQTQNEPFYWDTAKALFR